MPLCSPPRRSCRTNARSPQRRSFRTLSRSSLGTPSLRNGASLTTAGRTCRFVPRSVSIDLRAAPSNPSPHTADERQEPMPISSAVAQRRVDERLPVRIVEDPFDRGVVDESRRRGRHFSVTRAPMPQASVPCRPARAKMQRVTQHADRLAAHRVCRKVSSPTLRHGGSPRS